MVALYFAKLLLGSACVFPLTLTGQKKMWTSSDVCAVGVLIPVARI